MATYSNNPETGVNANRYSTSLKRPQVKKPKLIPLETFDSGHGFTLSAGAGTLSDDTDQDNHISHDQSLKLVVADGDSADNDIVNASISPTLDLTNRYWIVVWKCSKVSAISELRFHFGQSASQSYTYNAKSTFQNIFRGDNEWNYTAIDLTRVGKSGIPTSNLIDYLRIRFQTDGSEEITLWIDGIFAVAEASAGCVIIAGDDNKLSHYTKASPIAMKHGFQLTLYLISETLGNTGILSVEQAQKLQRFGHEICSHSNTDFTSLSESGLRDKLITIKQKMIEYGLQGLNHVSYPGGNDDETVIKVCKEFFSTGRIATSNIIINPPADPFVLGCYALASSIAPATVNTTIDDAITAKCPIIILFHEIKDSGASGNEYLTADFETILDHINTQGYTVKTLSEYYADL